MHSRSALTVVCLVLGALACGCETLVSSDVTYADCVRQPVPFVEQFDVDDAGLADRCWRAENVGDERRLETYGSDLLIRYGSASQEGLTYADDVPALLRRMPEDFVIVTHVETTEMLHSGFCVEPGDSAGIVVRGTEHGSRPELRAALLLWPDPVAARENCGDSDEIEVGAIIQGVSNDGREGTEAEPVGASGEADIAICRSGSQLTYFYRRPEEEDAAWVPEDWKQLVDDQGEPRDDEVGDGPLDVGLAAIAAKDGVEQLQGAFNWVAIQADGSVGEDCRGPLDSLLSPSND